MENQTPLKIAPGAKKPSVPSLKDLPGDQEVARRLVPRLTLISMNWKRMRATLSGSVDQELLLRNESVYHREAV